MTEGGFILRMGQYQYIYFENIGYINNWPLCASDWQTGGEEEGPTKY